MNTYDVCVRVNDARLEVYSCKRCTSRVNMCVCLSCHISTKVRTCACIHANATELAVTTLVKYSIVNDKYEVAGIYSSFTNERKDRQTYLKSFRNPQHIYYYIILRRSFNKHGPLAKQYLYSRHIKLVWPLLCIYV